MQRVCSCLLKVRPSWFTTRWQLLSDQASKEPTPGEKKLRSILKRTFPSASFLQVNDISGGCGSMYEVQIEAEEFRGKKTVMRHRMVTKALADEIKGMHGLRISTAAPGEEAS